MTRTDRVGRWIDAPRESVYHALVDRGALETWLPPEGMSGRIEHWDPRPGGGFRMVLTYLDASGSPGRPAGKTTAATDVADIAFADLVPPERVVQRVEFTSDDPSYAGTMTMTWECVEAAGGTEVTVTATDVPPGIERADHEAGIASSLAQLARFVG
ncbi:SRPBCC family protein [Streptomyces sp. LHD-70]|uniref:SRPBCC family protein n=1 Tax=Streptomyces sp. LHD-70 TaxID=3072140 RepID=UPI00280FFCF1|nr:SRPBCC family protein [Streptomyces sp. LHD-70]MDQ8703951.1 SRPBCC family protein [Streptomyces sp. LHD-70]